MKFVVDDKIPYLKGVLEEYGDVLYKTGKEINAADVKDADAMMIRTRTKINEELLVDSSVQFIATATIGHDHIDKNYLSENGVKWTNCPGCNSESVAQYMTSVFLTLAERHNWDLSQKTLGVIGVGNVGKKVALKAEALGMRVLRNDPPRAAVEGTEEFVELDQILHEADFITTHTPYTKEGEYKTAHLFNAETFKKMKNTAFISNSARGEIINNEDLREALKSGEIGGAVLDVFENEPDFDRELMERCDLVTSHIAGYSADGKAKGTSMSIQALSKHFGWDKENWFPETVPLPSPTDFTVDAKDKTKRETLKEVVDYTYQIEEDDALLRNNPDNFEYNRGSYAIHREFHNYTVELLNADDEVKSIVQKLGFKLK